MIVYRGWGAMALVIPCVFLIFVLVACAVLLPAVGPRWWMLGLALLPGGLVVFLWGRHLNATLDRAEQQFWENPPTDPMLHYAQSSALSQRHSMYGLRMEYWGVIQLVVGPILAVIGIVEGL